MAVKSTGLTTRGIRGEFFTSLNAVPNEWERLVTRLQSTGPSETYKWLGTVGPMREFINGRMPRGLRTESYSIENLKYENSVEVDGDEVHDDQLGQIRMRIQDMGLRAGAHKPWLIAQLLIYGATTGFNSYDGVTFFNANHVSGASGAQSNIVTQVKAATAPTAAEFQLAFAAAKAAMLKLKDDQGEPLHMDGAGLEVVVPPDLEFVARQALNAQIIASTTNVLTGAANLQMWPWLTTATDFFVAKTNTPVKGIVFQDREPVEFRALDETSEHYVKTGKLLYTCDGRYRMTYGMWQNIIKVSFTGP